MSVKIKNLHVNNLRNNAHLKFHMDAIALMTAENPANLNIQPLFNVYQPAVVREDEAFKKIVKSEFTEKIQTADKARDRVYSCITAIINALVKHYNDDVVDAAKRLKILIDTYGKGVNQLSYNEQTAAVYNILQEFNGKYAADVALVNITEMVNELERANNAVDALIKERMDETALKNPDNMKAVRIEADNAYFAIVERINAAVIIEGPDNYMSFITKLNVLIDSYKQLLARSKGKKQGDNGGDVDEGDDDYVDGQDD